MDEERLETPPKRSDRPHWITITLTIGALGVSMLSAYLSYRALTINVQYSAMAQRAYLTNRNTEAPRMETRANGSRVLHLATELLNGGNTPADEVRVKQTVYFEEGSPVPVQAFSDAVGFVGPKDTHMLETPIAIAASNLTPGNRLKGVIKIRGHADYRTRVDDQPHVLDWCVAYSAEQGIQLCPYKSYEVR